MHISADQSTIVSYNTYEDEEHHCWRGVIYINALDTGRMLGCIDDELFQTLNTDVVNGCLQLTPRSCMSPLHSKKRRMSLAMDGIPSEPLSTVTAIYYNEKNNEIYTGTNDGRILLWGFQML